MEDAAEVRVRPICHEPVLDEAWEAVMGVGLFRPGWRGEGPADGRHAAAFPVGW